MPYVLEYPADQSVVARATAAAYGASASEDARRYQDQQALAEAELGYRLDQQAIDAIQRQQAIDDSAYQFNAQLGQQMLQQEQDNELRWAGAGMQQQQIDQDWAALQQNAVGDEMALAGQQARAQATLNAANMRIMAAKEQERQRQNFERAMFLDQQIEEFARKGEFRTQEQYDQAKAEVFRQTGIESGAIQREFMNRQAQETEQKRQAALNSYSQMTGLTPQELESFVVDDGSGEFVLSDPDFVKVIATNKMDNRRMESIAKMNNEAALATARTQYEQKKADRLGKMRVRFDALKKDYADRHSQKADLLTGKEEKILDPDNLPLDVVQRLKLQAMSEYPPPPPPPGM